MQASALYTFISSERIDVFHYCMFHGEARRKGIDYPEDPSHNLGEDLSEPLVLSRNGRIVPDVFMPAGSLIVSGAVKEKLEPQGSLVFLPVVFKKLIDFPYQAGDFSYYDRPAFQKSPRREDPDTLIKRLPDVQELHRAIGSYYEVVVPIFDQIIAQYTDVQSARLEVEAWGRPTQVEIPLSQRLLADYPIIRAAGPDQILMILSPGAFPVMAPHIDWDYFARADVTFGKL